MHSVITPGFVGKPRNGGRLLALWRDSIAAEQTTVQSNHLHATGGDG